MNDILKNVSAFLALLIFLASFLVALSALSVGGMV